MPTPTNPSFEQLFQETYSLAARAAMTLEHNWHDAEDLVADAMESIVRHRLLEQHVQNGGTAEHWAHLVVAVVERRHADAVRHRTAKKRGGQTRTVAPGSRIRPAPSMADDELQSVIDRAVAALPGDLYLALRLKSENVLTDAQAGDVMSISEDAYGRLLKKARVQIVEAITKAEADDPRVAALRARVGSSRRSGERK